MDRHGPGAALARVGSGQGEGQRRARDSSDLCGLMRSEWLIGHGPGTEVARALDLGHRFHHLLLRWATTVMRDSARACVRV